MTTALPDAGTAWFGVTLQQPLGNRPSTPRHVNRIEKFSAVIYFEKFTDYIEKFSAAGSEKLRRSAPRGHLMPA